MKSIRAWQFIGAVALINATVGCSNGGGGGSSSSNQNQYANPYATNPYARQPYNPYNRNPNPNNQFNRPQGYQQGYMPQGQGPQGYNGQGYIAQGSQPQYVPPGRGMPGPIQGPQQQPVVIDRGIRDSGIASTIKPDGTTSAGAGFAVRSSRESGASDPRIKSVGETVPAPTVSELQTNLANGVPQSIRLAAPAPAPAPQVQVVAQAQAPEAAPAVAPTAATTFDTNAGNVGPGWPKTYSPSKSPLFTGAADDRGQVFTDGKDDSVMAVMVEKMNQLAETTRADSEQLAQAVNDVHLQVDRQTVNLDVSFKFSDTEFTTSFTGILSGRTATLTTRQNSSSYQFTGNVTCVDAGTDCRIAVISLNQIVDGQVCRKIYITHRWMMDGVGDGHFTLSLPDYLNWKSRVSAAQRAFLRLVANTVHYNKVLFKEIPAEAPKSPRLSYLGLRMWAVAYGKSYFEIEMSKMNKSGGRGDTTRFYGPLTKPNLAGQASQELNVAGKYADAEVNEKFDERFDRNLSQVLLIDNDGRGNLTLQFDFYGELSKDGAKVTETTGSSRVNFTGLRINTLSAAELRTLIP